MPRSWKLNGVIERLKQAIKYEHLYRRPTLEARQLLARLRGRLRSAPDPFDQQARILLMG
jgi:hypothetical protein